MGLFGSWVGFVSVFELLEVLELLGVEGEDGEDESLMDLRDGVRDWRCARYVG